MMRSRFLSLGLILSLPPSLLADTHYISNTGSNMYPYTSVREQVEGRAPNFGFIIVSDPDSDAKIAEIQANEAGTLAEAKLVIAYRERR